MIVMEDGASVHGGLAPKAARAVLRIEQQSHPPSLPNLKPIETRCRLVKEAIRGMDRRPTSVDKLWATVQAVWDSIPQAQINSIIESMDDRREAVELANGHQTRW